MSKEDKLFITLGFVTLIIMLIIVSPEMKLDIDKYFSDYVITTDSKKSDYIDIYTDNEITYQWRRSLTDMDSIIRIGWTVSRIYSNTNDEIRPEDKVYYYDSTKVRSLLEIDFGRIFKRSLRKVRGINYQSKQI